MNKILIYIVGGAALFLLGGIAVPEILKFIHGPAPAHVCPDCYCPEPTVSVQPFEVEKIKGLREFVYSPQFSGSISVAGVDSTALRRMIDQSMSNSFAKFLDYDKKKRK